MTFAKFYRDVYLPRHAAPVCKWLHLLGVPIAAAYAGIVAWLGQWWLLVFIPVPVYVLGWVGHMLAHNRPTSFEHPLLSFLAFWKMFLETFSGHSKPDSLNSSREEQL
jgi:hypothetical protein